MHEPSTAGAARWPWYRRSLLADALADHPDDPVARAAAYEAACAREVEPWYRSALELDRAGADPAGSGRAAGLAGSEQGRALAAVFAAAATDPVIGRALVRSWNLLVTPAGLMADAELMARMAEVMAHPEDHPLPAPVGPTRAALLEALANPEEALHA